MGSARVTYRRRKSYNTKSNKIRKVKTPGGRLVAQYTKKKAALPKLAMKTRTRVSGVKALRPHEYKKISKTQRSVTRPYSGVYSPKELKERITRAFLVDELKTVKATMALKMAEKKE